MDYYRLCKKYIHGKRMLVMIVLLVSVCCLIIFKSTREYKTLTLSHVTRKIFNGENIRTNTEVKRNKDVLIFGYMRGGTTLVADFYRNSPGVFFVFEPLMPYAYYHYFTNTSRCFMRHTQCVNVNRTQIVEVITTLTSLYSCNIHKLPSLVIDEILKQNKSSPAWFNFGKCLNDSKAASADNKKCFHQINQVCRKADIRVTKVLRLAFTHMDFLLMQSPDLHVIYLLRDPRAILNSRILTDWFPVSENDTPTVISNVDSLCKKMKSDHLSFKYLQKKYNERIQLMWIDRVTESEGTMMNLFYNYRKSYTMQTKDREFLDFVFDRKRNKWLFGDWHKTLKTNYTVYIIKKCSQFIPGSEAYHKNFQMSWN
ncbi:hypothetical protein ACF0H5_015865 [Mactra antiquata]